MMKIEIKNNGDTLILTNENLNNNNYVGIYIQDGEEYIEFTAPIDELYSTITAFKTLKDERKEM